MGGTPPWHRARPRAHAQPAPSWRGARVYRAPQQPPTTGAVPALEQPQPCLYEMVHHASWDGTEAKPSDGTPPRRCSASRLATWLGLKGSFASQFDCACPQLPLRRTALQTSSLQCPDLSSAELHAGARFGGLCCARSGPFQANLAHVGPARATNLTPYIHLGAILCPKQLLALGGPLR